MDTKTESLPFDWGSRTYVMGIVNCSPDSFSGDGIRDHQNAIDQGLRMVEEGADLIDVGGVSTRPGSTPIEQEEELRRIMLVISGLAGRVQVPISVDTYRSSVALSALQAGASIVNDVWAMTRDDRMPNVVAKSGAAVILMHNRQAPAVVGKLGGHYDDVPYENPDIIQAVGEELEGWVNRALEAGIAREKIIVDPGIGFGKGVTQNLELLRRLGDLKQITGLRSLPLLVGTSRKSVVGLTLNLPPADRLEGTLATLALAIEQGADIVRVHDVKAAVRCCRMAEAIVRGR